VHFLIERNLSSMILKSGNTIIQRATGLFTRKKVNC
jgi:hypothetical protein